MTNLLNNPRGFVEPGFVNFCAAQKVQRKGETLHSDVVPHTTLPGNLAVDANGQCGRRNNVRILENQFLIKQSLCSDH